MNFNFDAIEQLQVLTSAYDPEYGQNLGGAINIVTETGGNTLEFNVYGQHLNGEWGPKGDAIFASDGFHLAPTDFDSKYRTTQLSGKVSGPVIRDRMWFIASYQYSRTLIARTGIDLPRDFDGHYVLGKLTYSPNASHRITLLGQTDPTTIDNTDQSSRFINPEDRVVRHKVDGCLHCVGNGTSLQNSSWRRRRQFKRPTSKCMVYRVRTIKTWDITLVKKKRWKTTSIS